MKTISRYQNSTHVAVHIHALEFCLKSLVTNQIYEKLFMQIGTESKKLVSVPKYYFRQNFVYV